jgi:predicted NAD/FAD-dependent oxidoreductase
MQHAPPTWPAKSDRICVIGGGPAGIHMAYLLGAMGYDRVVVLEAADRLGGKSSTYVDSEGVIHEQGTCYVSNDYLEIKQWLQRYDMDEYVPALQDGNQGQQVWKNIKDEPTTFREYALETSRDAGAGGILGVFDLAVGLSVIRGLKKYMRLHEELLGTYEGQLPPRPSDEVLTTLSQPFQTWLEANDLEHLVPVFFLTHTTQGYGPLEDIPAFYALMWNTPQMIQGYIDTLKGSKTSGFDILLTGWQRLWERMAEEGHFEVRLGARVTSVVRSDASVELTLDGSETPEVFDYLVIACPFPSFLPVLDASDEERDIMGALSCYYFTTTVFRSVQGHRTQFLFDRWFDNLSADRPFAVVAQRLTQQAYDPALGENDPTARETRVGYQFSTRPIPVADQDQAFHDHYDAFGARDVQVLSRLRTEYFWKFDGDALREGYPWRLLDLQGTNRTLYIGASACFESVNDVVAYNRALLKRMGITAPGVDDLPASRPCP